MDAGIQQPIKQLVLPEAPIEPVTVFGEIRSQMFRADSMVGARNERFGIADDPVQPLKRLAQIGLIGFHPVDFP